VFVGPDTIGAPPHDKEPGERSAIVRAFDPDR
jgi:hypothetical protein